MVARIILDIEQNASLDSASQIRAAMSQALTSCTEDQKVVQNILLCISELHTNAVKYSPEISQVKIFATLAQHTFIVDILDDGLTDLRETQELNLNAGKKPIDVFDLDSEGGRGFTLLHQLCDSLELLTPEQFTPMIDTAKWTQGTRIQWQLEAVKKRAKILVVDDDPALVHLYTAYLNKNFDVINASNGADALYILEHRTVDIVVSDINMPHMNGITLCQSIKNSDQHSATPFIFLTMEDNQSTIEQASRMGIDDYLCKPISKIELINTIDRALVRFRRLSDNLNQRIDEKITASLLPSIPPKFHTWQLQSAFRSVGHGGGDFMIAHQTDEALTVLVCDVMGHDETAKFFSFAYAGYLRGLLLANENNISPAALLEQLSAGMFQDQLMNQLNVTCCAIQLRADRQLRYACAGHPPPLLINQQGLRELPQGGMMPGLLPDQQYKNCEYTCHKGDRLGIYTDGIFEATSSNEEREALEHSIRETLASSINQSNTEAIGAIFTVFDSQTKMRPTDDALLLLLETET